MEKKNKRTSNVNVTLSIDSDVIIEFKKNCNARHLIMSGVVQSLIEKFNKDNEE